MKKIKTCALAGIIAVSTSFGSSAYADTIGCTASPQIDVVIDQFEQVIAALEQWISKRTPADPHYNTQMITLNIAKDRLNTIRMYPGKVAFYSHWPCNIDVSPA